MSLSFPDFHLSFHNSILSLASFCLSGYLFSISFSGNSSFLDAQNAGGSQSSYQAPFSLCTTSHIASSIPSTLFFNSCIYYPTPSSQFWASDSHIQCLYRPKGILNSSFGPSYLNVLSYWSQNPGSHIWSLLFSIIPSNPSSGLLTPPPKYI